MTFPVMEIGKLLFFFFFFFRFARVNLLMHQKRDRSLTTARLEFDRNKLERGTLSAFRREARNILSRQQNNIIKISKAKIAASKVKSGAHNFKYFFQHPVLRLFVSYLVIFCNFLIFAEDPVSHSKQGKAFQFIGDEEKIRYDLSFLLQRLTFR